VKRREFITLAGGAVAWPQVARAQQTAMPVIGFVSSLAHSDLGLVVPGFHEGLNAAGFIEGRNIAIEYRWAESDYQRLPALAADLVNRKVVVIAAISGTPAALAAKAATTTIPIVFAIGGDPITPGLVTSLNRPGGNVTGVSFYSAPLVTKRLDLARELVPTGGLIAVLVNPDNPPSVDEGFHEWTPSRLGEGTRICDVPGARLYDPDVLAKSGGHRKQHEHRKSQIRPSHINLQSCERAQPESSYGHWISAVRQTLGRTSARLGCLAA